MKRTRLTESNLNRIVKKILNENIGNLRDDFSLRSRKVLSSIDDYNSLLKKGDYKKAGDSLDLLRRDIKRLEDVIQDIKRKI